MKINTSLKKYLSVNALGFGFGGLLWGLVLYNELPDLEYPFHYLAVIIMALFGGLTLVWFNKSIRNISKSVVAGILGWTVGIVVFTIFDYLLFLFGIYFLSIFSFLGDSFFMLIDFGNLGIGSFWLVFLLIGMIIGFFYAIFLKTKIWSLIWRAGLGLGLASLISPVIGNLIGNYFDSLLLSYLITFSLIGIIFSKFLSWGIYYGGEKDKKIS